jgi:hypothetical protein
VLLAALLGLATQLPVATAAADDVQLEQKLLQRAHRLEPEVLGRALTAYRCAQQAELVDRPGLLTLIDYAKPSTEPRLWVLDLERGRVLYEERVAHGRNSGEDLATSFSNVPESKQSSLGVFKTAGTYTGQHGLSLRLIGLEAGINDQAMDRAIVMHGADYVSTRFIRKQGRLGRSWGCPAVRREVARPLVRLLRGGSLIFAHYPDRDWLESSHFLNGCNSTVIAQSAPSQPAT